MGCLQTTSLCGPSKGGAKGPGAGGRRAISEALSRFLDQANIEAVLAARAESYFDNAEPLRAAFAVAAGVDATGVETVAGLSAEQAKDLLASGTLPAGAARPSRCPLRRVGSCCLASTILPPLLAPSLLPSTLSIPVLPYLSPVPSLSPWLSSAPSAVPSSSTVSLYTFLW